MPGAAKATTQEPLRGNAHEGMDRVSDEDVLARIQGGDPDAFGCLFSRYRRLVFSVAVRILRWEAEAEDVTQDVFCEIFQVSRNFDPGRGSVRTWLLQYAYHRSLNRKRYLQVRLAYSMQQPAVSPDKEASGLTGHEWRGLNCLEWPIALRQAIARLPQQQRQTMEDFLGLGLQLKEIAEYRSESSGNVRHHYYRGVANLRKVLPTHC